jgi:hypothetical protein
MAAQLPTETNVTRGVRPAQGSTPWEVGVPMHICSSPEALMPEWRKRATLKGGVHAPKVSLKQTCRLLYGLACRQQVFPNGFDVLSRVAAFENAIHP